VNDWRVNWDGYSTMMREGESGCRTSRHTQPNAQPEVVWVAEFVNPVTAPAICHYGLAKLFSLFGRLAKHNHWPESADPLQSPPAPHNHLLA